MRHAPRVHAPSAAIALVAFGAALVLAQGQSPFAESQKANAQALRQYRWTSRTELKLKGESKNVKLEQVRYDLNGQIQKTAMGGLVRDGAQLTVDGDLEGHGAPSYPPSFVLARVR